MHTHQEVTRWISAWFAERAPDVALQPTDNYFERGAIDSFDVIVLVEEIEAHFNIRFAEVEFQDRRFATIDGLAEIILEKSR